MCDTDVKCKWTISINVQTVQETRLKVKLKNEVNNKITD